MSNACTSLFIDLGNLFNTQKHIQLLPPGPRKTSLEKSLQQQIDLLYKELEANHC
jgi:hypothetical protein